MSSSSLTLQYLSNNKVASSQTSHCEAGAHRLLLNTFLHITHITELLHFITNVQLLKALPL